MLADNPTETYYRRHAGQLPALGRKGHKRLARFQVHVCGLGRVGTSVVLNLIAAGTLRMSANDPQHVAEDNLGPLIHTRSSDLGKPKVAVLQSFLRRARPSVRFDTVHAPTESPDVDPLMKEADLVVLASNTPASRIAGDTKALRYGTTSVNVGVADGRECLGGMISLRLPDSSWHACAACMLPPGTHTKRGEALLTPVVALMAAHAAQLILQIGTGLHRDCLDGHNLWVVDAATHRVRTMAVERRPNCPVCNATQQPKPLKPWEDAT